MIGEKHGKYYLKHNSLTEDIAIAIIFKGLGITSDQEIVQLIGLEDFIDETMTPCLYEAHSTQVYTQLQV
jgi:DNA-directed RNA polymerase III subunit RPC2